MITGAASGVGEVDEGAAAEAAEAVEAAGLRPLRADAARNRERILEAAAEVFAQRGLDATLDDVAHHAGVGVGTVYRRFPGKESLVEALFEKRIASVVDLAVQAAHVAEPWDGLVWFLERVCQSEAEDLGLRDVIFYGLYGQDRVARAKERIVPAVSRLIDRAQRDGSLRSDVVTADVLIIEMMVNAVASQTIHVDRDLWRRYLRIVVDGLRTARSQPSVLPAAPSVSLMSDCQGGRPH